MTRTELERRVADEEDVLERVARLLREQVPADQWPPELLSTLDLAMDDTGLRSVEARKARSLSRHLFGWDPVPWPQSADPTHPNAQGRAERLRADLPGIVPLRSGRRCSGGHE